MKFVMRIVATVFGSGLSPVAPGTAASLLVALLYMAVVHRASWPAQAAIIAAVFLAGVPAASGYAAELGRKDPARVVVDEACGQLIALFLAPSDPVAVGAAFLLFRAFDIFKPFPIRRLERLPGGWGIMADDVAAGLLSAVVLRIGLAVLR